MPSFVHTILVHRHFVPLHFVHAIFCPNNFSPKILCAFIFVFQVFSTNTVGTLTFCLIDIYSPTIILCPISFFYGAVLSQAHVSILVSLCPASSYFRNSFTKPLNSHVFIICPISQYSPHHRPSAHTEHTIQSWSNRCYYNNVGTSMISANIVWPYLHRLSCLVISYNKVLQLGFSVFQN